MPVQLTLAELNAIAFPRSPSRVTAGTLSAPSAQAPVNVEQAIRDRAPFGGHSGSRTPFILTCDEWRLRGSSDPSQVELALHSGPSQATWHLPLRAQSEPNKGGRAHFAQRRNIGHGDAHHPAATTFYDFPTVDFEFQAGNIMPIPLGNGQVAVAGGLRDFYRFMELVNQPPLVTLAGELEGKHNFTWIFYNSLQFPELTLKGYFEPDGIQWTDSAEDPAALTWSAAFVVYEMTPNIWESDSMLSRYEDVMRNNPRFL